MINLCLIFRSYLDIVKALDFTGGFFANRHCPGGTFVVPLPLLRSEYEDNLPAL